MKPVDQMTLAELDAEYDALMEPLKYHAHLEEDAIRLDGTFMLDDLRTLVRIAELVAETRRRGFP